MTPMNGGLLWVNKHTSSAHLSRSSKAETAKIRAHVRRLSVQSRARRKSAHPLRSTRKNRKSTPPGSKTAQLEPLSCPEEIDNAEDSMPASLDKSKSNRIFASALTWLPTATAHENRSFLFFLKRTAQEWSSYRDVSFWNVLVPQASAAHQAIFHSVTALGALHESLENSDEPDKENHLQQLLWQQCSRAAYIANQGQVSYMVALMSCIILVCLQNLQSNPMAFQMLKTGSNIVNDVETRIADGTLILTPSEMTMLEECLKPILERLGTRYCFIVDLPSAFASHVASKQAQWLPRTEIPALPQAFSTLLEARNSLEQLVAWCIVNTTSTDEDFGPYCHDKDLVESLLTQWTYLLENVDSAAYKEHPNLAMSKSLLKAAGMVAKILFDTLGSIQECIYDKHLSKFREIVRIYDVVSKTSPKNRTQKVPFGIDTGIIHTLAFSIGHCRDPALRRESLSLLERDDRVEGDLRASTVLKVLRELVTLEESGKEVTRQEDVPEKDRVQIWEEQQFWHSGLVKIYLVRSPYDPQRGAAFQEVWARTPIRIVNDPNRPPSPVQQKSWNLELPNVVFARGMAAFLDESSGTYHKVILSSLFLPMPRM